MELENTDAFRRDLFHRINVLRLELPPLRERGDDIEGLTNWLVKRVAERLGVEPKTLSDEAYNALSDYSWPGNVRELEHTIERALVLADGRWTFRRSGETATSSTSRDSFLITGSRSSDFVVMTSSAFLQLLYF